MHGTRCRIEIVQGIAGHEGQTSRLEVCREVFDNLSFEAFKGLSFHLAFCRSSLWIL